MAVALTLPTVNASNGTWGTTLNAALNQVNGYDVFAYKTADESVSASTTQQNDDHMIGLTLVEGTWLVQSTYIVSGPAAADFKVAWTFGGLMTGYRVGAGPATSNTDALGGTAQAVRLSGPGGNTTTPTSTIPYGTDGTNWSHITESGVLVVTAVGDLAVQWSQNVSNATATILRAGSWIHARRMA